MSRFLTADADLIHTCISRLDAGEALEPCAGEKPVDQEILNQLVSDLPPDRFTEAVRFLVRMRMAALIPNGICPCGSTRFDVLPIHDEEPSPFPEPGTHDG